MPTCGFGGGEPMDPASALGGFLRALGVPPQRVPADLAEQVALYRTVTASSRLLVLLDNALTPAQVRVLIPASASSTVLVTSRRRLGGLVSEGARLVEVRPLPADDAIELLARAVGRDRITRERRFAEDLAHICGGLPIALCVSAARLAARPRLSLRSMVSELADETGRLMRLADQDGISVRTTLELSYRYLGPAPAAVYRRLSLHPGPEFGTGPVTVLSGQCVNVESPSDGVSAAYHDDGAESELSLPSAEASVSDLVEQLVDANLLEEVAEERFRVHDLLRLYAQEKALTDETAAERDAARRAMLEWYLAAAGRADQVLTPYRRRLPYTFTARLAQLPHFTGRQDALAWLERERVNLVHAARAAMEHDYPQLTWHLADVMWPLFLFHKHYRDWIEIDELGVQAARSWGNVWAEADMLKRLGRVCNMVGRHVEAERHTRAAIDRYREAGDERGCLDAEDGLACLYRDTGRTDLAIALYGRLLTANRERGDVRSAALTCISLGMLLNRVGRAQDAMPLLLEAREAFDELADVDPYNGVRVLIGLAGAHLGVGDLQTAEETAAEAAQRMRDLGSEHERVEALDVLGQVAQRRGDAAAARRHYQQALSIFESLGSLRARDLARQLGQLDSVVR